MDFLSLSYAPDGAPLAVTEFMEAGSTFRMAWVPTRGGHGLFHCQSGDEPAPDSFVVPGPQSVAMAPFPSIDGRRLYFMSSRPGGLGGADCDFWDCFDLYVATRTCGDERREE